MISEKTLAGLKAGRLKTKFKLDGFYRELLITTEHGRLVFNFGYDESLLNAVKTRFENRKYHGYLEGDGRKIWSAPITPRNLFQLEALQGKYGVSPYVNWAKIPQRQDEIRQYVNVERHSVIPQILLKKRGLKDGRIFNHQVEMINDPLAVHWFLMGAEMGTGKTLAAIITVEMMKYQNAIWLGPLSALAAAKLEFKFWDVNWAPKFMSYNAIVKAVANWKGQAPRVFVMDEVSRCKSHVSQRSDACQYVADSMRKEWGFDCLILGLSGAPAPKAPSDWWKPCEILCPGFITEANWFLFRQRIGHVRKEESGTEGGGHYNKLFTWRDSESKCHYCGELKNHINHTQSIEARMTGGESSFEPHVFKPGINEVARIAKRTEGLVRVWLKEDHLDLPPKQYKVVELPVSTEILNIAKLAVQSCTRGADALIKLRTISDGFMYHEEETGERESCAGCSGTGYIIEDEDQVKCYTCKGQCTVPVYKRSVTEYPCPKIDLFTELLARHEECGRFVTYAGFQGSIDRLVRTTLQKGWDVIKADGRGWKFHSVGEGVIALKPEDMLEIFQEGQAKYPKVEFIGQPGAAGIGLTLTASPSIFFYSNDFLSENRIQAEDRGHRPGMGENFWIIDCVHLPSDRKILTSLKESRDLQRLSMKGALDFLEA